MNYEFNIKNISKEALFRYQCVDPPVDWCDFDLGPCPNPDVTGIGQQLSLYVTSTVFAITIIHSPVDIRVAAYSQLANLGSLLIAALISLNQGSLTQNDAIFILVATISPGNIYIWAIGLRALLISSPQFLASQFPNRHEHNLLLVLSSLPFFLWIALLAMIFRPSHRFSQPACDVKYGEAAIWKLLWSPMFLGSLIIGYGSLVLFGARDRENPTDRIQAEIIPWTRNLLKRSFGPLGESRHGRAAILLLMQIADINIYDPKKRLHGVDRRADPISVFDRVAYWTELAVSVLLSMIFIWARPFLSWTTIYVIWGISSTGILAAVAVESFYSPIILWSSLRRVIISCIIAVFYIRLLVHDWKLIPESTIRSRIRWVAIFLIWIGSGIWVGTNITLVPLNMLISPQLAWFCLWEGGWFWQNAPGLQKIGFLWEHLVGDTPVFKFTFFVLGPTVMWIKATLQANPTNSSQMAFGQVFALFTSLVSLASLLNLIWKKRCKILRAVWNLEKPERRPRRAFTI